ncbi:hypothetical protein [Agromyces silvae]|uniref:hypothetical protein n=1 Tax=Agromyces silvae TaxID=3388266 RepID=UPI00280A5EB5|nr:hypothetical protein [Agromyces protaetiae]
MQHSAELLVMHLHDADLRHAEQELERRRQAGERAAADGDSPEASVTRRRHRPAARTPRLALR